eukprot:COSAG05_NODE_293_length_12007_cov_209.909473_2_plen_81_part_00
MPRVAYRLHFGVAALLRSEPICNQVLVLAIFVPSVRHFYVRTRIICERKTATDGYHIMIMCTNPLSILVADSLYAQPQQL